MYDRRLLEERILSHYLGIDLISYLKLNVKRSTVAESLVRRPEPPSSSTALVRNPARKEVELLQVSAILNSKSKTFSDW